MLDTPENTRSDTIRLALAHAIDSIPRWPLYSLHIPGVLDPQCFGSVLDSVMATFVASGSSYTGCQAYADVHKSRDDSRKAVLALFAGQNVPTASEFLQLATTCTLIIREAYKILPIARELRNVWKSRFSCHINTNLYLSSPTSDAFPLHQDPHHVCALQLVGSKQWWLCAGERSEVPHIQTNQSTEALCQPGDMLFIPKGTLHRAKAADISVHVSISVEEQVLSREPG
jgi:hypothetical protein